MKTKRKTKRPARRAPQQPNFTPVMLGRITLSAGEGEVRDARLHAGMIVIFSVNSPDSLSEGARVSVSQLDEGILVFWAHNAQSQQTDDEPEVHFAVYDSFGHFGTP